MYSRVACYFGMKRHCQVMSFARIQESENNCFKYYENRGLRTIVSYFGNECSLTPDDT